MLKKICAYCLTTSYGSSNDFWICPHCKKDITNLPADNADTEKNVLGDFIKSHKE